MKQLEHLGQQEKLTSSFSKLVMPQYCSKVPSKRDKFELSTTDWSQPQSKMLSSGRMKYALLTLRRQSVCFVSVFAPPFPRHFGETVCIEVKEGHHLFV